MRHFDDYILQLMPRSRPLRCERREESRHQADEHTKGRGEAG
jgi:hypothetical protein